MHPVGIPVLLITLLAVCYLASLFVKLRRLSRRQTWLRNRLSARHPGQPARRRRSRYPRKE
ncbi:hypothetical protein B5M10_24990 [Pluralibacter gergoviae]|nr:hypothetical protein B5M10_24990 [Pluralibacter gergoviae]